jgi:hypothetical protein
VSNKGRKQNVEERRCVEKINYDRGIKGRKVKKIDKTNVNSCRKLFLSA